ncbi:MAG: c-type cytochrome [Adhaeribacter sp.]
MKKFFKWAGLLVGAVLVLLLLGFGFIYFQTDKRFSKQYAVRAQAIALPGDSLALAQGHHLVKIKGCNDCHGPDLGGKVVVDDPGLGYLTAPNLTGGKGGLIARYGSYSDADYVRAIKHGLGKDNRSLKLMPSYEYNPLSQQDLGALIAYLKTVPPVDREMDPIALKPLAYVLTHFDKLPLISAEKIDHEKQSLKEVPAVLGPAYGQYVAVGCTGCHRDNFRGGSPVIPGSPEVPDITATGKVGKWTEAQFVKTMRTGLTPEGKKLDPQFMPWPMAREFTDTEIKSLYLFLTGKRA